MERLLVKLAAGTSDLESCSGGSGTNKGLDKVLALAGLGKQHTNLLYGCYLNQRMALVKLKAYLLVQNGWYSGENQQHKLKLVNGAVKAITTNAYRSAKCYKCDGTGVIKGQECPRCAGIGSSVVKPKEYELSGFSRSLWHKKEYRYLRDSFTALVDLLLVLDAELRKSISINSRDN